MLMEHRSNEQPTNVIKRQNGIGDLSTHAILFHSDRLKSARCNCLNQHGFFFVRFFHDRSLGGIEQVASGVQQVAVGRFIVNGFWPEAV